MQMFVLLLLIYGLVFYVTKQERYLIHKALKPRGITRSYGSNTKRYNPGKPSDAVP
jgi:hypothetical protein